VLPGWSAARRLLRGPLRRLVGGQVVGQAADGLAQIAFAQVVLFEVGRGASPWELAKLLAVTLLPFSLAGPVAGVVIDRWDRRRALVVASLGRAAVAAAAVGVLAARSEPAAYAGIVLLLSLSRFVLVAKGAALPRTVEPAGLVVANAVSSLAGLAAAFAGAIAGSAFVAAAPAAGFLGAAGGYLAAAVLFARLPPVGGGSTAGTGAVGLRRLGRDLAEEVRAVARVAAIRRPLVAVWSHRLLLGAGFVIVVLVADSRYGLEAPGYGLALLVTGAGAVAGSVAAPALARRFPPPALLPATFAVAGSATGAAGFGPGLAALVLATGVAAFAFQVLKVRVDALVQDAAHDGVRGRVVSAYDVLYNVAFVAAALALVPLWRPGREHALLWWLAAAFGACGLLLARAYRSWPFRATRPRHASRPRPRRWRGRAAAAVAGTLPVLAFPEADAWWLGFVGLVPLLLLVRAAPTAGEAAVRAWAGGTGFFLAMHHWLLPNLGPFTVVVGPLLGTLWAAWGPVAWGLLHDPASGRRLVAAMAVLPAAWVVIEVLRSWDRLAGPWGLLGASQAGNLPVLAVASLGGVWLLSAVLVAVNVAGTVALAPGTPTPARAAALGAAAALVVAATGYGLLRPPPPGDRAVVVAGVQPGHISGYERRFDAHLSATRALAGGADAAVDLVVWGESSVGFDLQARPERLAAVAEVAGAVGADVLVNVDARRGPGGIFKSAVLVGPDGVTARYDKMRLVPFGEYVPMRRVLGWVSGVTEAADEDRRRGEDLVVMDTAGIRAGPLVCFESAFPDLTRRLARRGADLIVLQTATTTFQGSWAQAQHAALSAVRAVESGRPVVHAAVSGVSAVFDARGRRLAGLHHDQAGTYRATVPLSPETTPYARFGDWVPAAAVLVLGAAAVRAALATGRALPPRGADL
jgi:apolipoprotein N-acyltransferase